MKSLKPSSCEDCFASRQSALKHLNIKIEKCDYVVALAGNPNTGKSTVFNALTGLKQHTGNWPGKTISRAEGAFQYNDRKYKLVDLPGTYSLHTQSPDEEVARDFILNGQPDVTIVVCDATAIVRNLNLAIQIRQMTGKVVVALNLMDEARRSGIEIDIATLSKELGVEVVPMAARRKEGLPELLDAVDRCAKTTNEAPSLSVDFFNPKATELFNKLRQKILSKNSEITHPDWKILRLLQGDAYCLQKETGVSFSESILEEAQNNIHELSLHIDDEITGAIYARADHIGHLVLKENHSITYTRVKALLDTILIGKWTGIPIMGLIFTLVLWMTISGANVPSGMLATLLIDHGYTFLKELATSNGFPLFLSGLLIDGIYLTLAWVISVMLPPMAIFFPLFTLLEDFGYLPRVAFNLDGLFKKSGAHGKQALTMAMGYGCNAAGVIAARIIESPRERLIAIITNNFSLCNGRWPTQILIATVFLGALVPQHFSGLISTLAVGMVGFFGVILTFLTSWLLSKTLLKGEPSAFSLELPPYRPPQILQTLYKSIIDRTLFVLWRAIVFAVPAGAIIWLVSNIQVNDQAFAILLIDYMDPFATVFGLTGVILLAYIIAIPANEIVIPTILMLTVMQTGISIEGAAGAGVMFETDEANHLMHLLTAGGWTTLTAISLMVFSLCHNPCSTTIYTIYKETRSVKWTSLATFLPLVYGFILCALITLLSNWVPVWI